MKCSLLTLSCALDGELSKERQAELEAHLVTCERCRTGMRYLREETERISQLARVQIGTSTATTLLERARVAPPEAAAPPSGKAAPSAADAHIIEVPGSGPGAAPAGSAWAGTIGSLDAAAAQPLPEIEAARDEPPEDGEGDRPPEAATEDPQDSPDATASTAEEILPESTAELAPADAEAEAATEPEAAAEGRNSTSEKWSQPSELGALDDEAMLEPVDPSLYEDDPEVTTGSSWEAATVEGRAEEGEWSIDTPEAPPASPPDEPSATPPRDALGAEGALDTAGWEAGPAELETPEGAEDSPTLWQPAGPVDGSTASSDESAPAEIVADSPLDRELDEQAPGASATDPDGSSEEASPADTSPADASPWRRSWTPEPTILPVWTPPPADESWEEPAIVPEEAGLSADHEELMQVAFEESASLQDSEQQPDSEEQPAAPGPVWTPPSPAQQRPVEAWNPRTDLLLDIAAARTTEEPEAKSVPTIPPPSPPRRPSETVAPIGSIEDPMAPPPRPTATPRRGGRGPRAPRPESTGGVAPRSWTRTATVAIAALAVFLIGWALLHQGSPAPASHPQAHSSTPSSAPSKPATTPSAAPSTAPTLALTGTQTFGSTGSGYQVQSARYGLHQNGTQLWVVFQLAQGSGSPKVTTGFDGGTTLYVEMAGVAAGTAVSQPPSGELVTSVAPGHVSGFTGAVYVLKLSRAATVSGYLLPGSPTGSAGERVVLQLQ